jgi:hypothetical protein
MGNSLLLLIYINLHKLELKFSLFFYLPQPPARLRYDEVVAGGPPYKGGELTALPLDKGESPDIRQPADRREGVNSKTILTIKQ